MPARPSTLLVAESFGRGAQRSTFEALPSASLDAWSAHCECCSVLKQTLKLVAGSPGLEVLNLYQELLEGMIHDVIHSFQAGTGKKEQRTCGPGQSVCFT